LRLWRKNKNMKWFKKKHKHKWEQAYISGYIGGVKVKFIATYCTECRFGRKELMETAGKIETIYCTYNEKYFIDDSQSSK